MKTNFKILTFLVLLLYACDKKDPILPGVRSPVFDGGAQVVLSNKSVKDLVGDFKDQPAIKSELYEMSDENILTRKSDGKVIFKGFPTATKTGAPARPIASNGFVYAGLSTGEVLKVSASDSTIKWMIDLGGRSLITGGSPVSDISVLMLNGGNLYASSLAGVFAKISADNGKVIWSRPFQATGEIFVSGSLVAFVDLSGDLIALDAKDGALVLRRAANGKDVGQMIKAELK